MVGQVIGSSKQIAEVRAKTIFLYSEHFRRGVIEFSITVIATITALCVSFRFFAFRFDFGPIFLTNPPSWDHFDRHGAYNFAAGNLICRKASLNQKSWMPNGDQAKALTWRVAYSCTFTFSRVYTQYIIIL